MRRLVADNFHIAKKLWKMSLEGEYLTVEPSQLQFVPELGKQLTSQLRLSNNTDNHIVFKAATMNPNEYCIHPDRGVVMPRSVFDITVTMQAQKEFPEDMECNDKFLLKSSITIPGDVDLYEFDKKSGYSIQRLKLRIVYISPRPPSPIVGTSEGGSPSSTPVSDDENSYTSDLSSIFKSDEEPQNQNSEITKPGHHPANARSDSVENLLRELATDKPRQFSHADIIKFTSNRFTELGSGAFGNVYKGQFDGVEIAVKILVENEVIEEEFMAKVSTKGRMYHRNLVKLYGFCFDDNMKVLVYKYALSNWADVKPMVITRRCANLSDLGRFLWKVLPHALTWCIWRERNARVF